MMKLLKLGVLLCTSLLFTAEALLAQQILVGNDSPEYDGFNVSHSFEYSPQFSVYQTKAYKVYSPKQLCSLQSATEQVTVTINSINADGYTPTAIALYNNSITIPITDLKKSVSVMVPKGTYDLHVVYEKALRTYIVFKEQVVINADKTIEFDPTTATNPYTIKSYNESGEEMTLNQYEGNKVVFNGNTTKLNSTTCFVVKGQGIVLLKFGGDYRVKGISEEFNVNNVSDRIYFIDGRKMTHNGKQYFLCCKGDLKKSIVANDYTKIKAINQKFETSQFGHRKEFDNSHYAGFDFTLSYKGNMVANTRFSDSKLKAVDGVIGFMADLSNQGDNDFQPLVKLRYCDAKYKGEKDSFSTFFFIVTPSITVKNNKLTYINHGLPQRFEYDNTGQNSVIMPGAEAYSFLLEEYANEPFGATCPIASVITYNNGTQLVPAYIGRYGEEHMTDFFTAKGTKKEDGNITIYNLTTENVLVSGHKAKHTLIHEVQTNADDNVAPTLQMLQLRNNRGKITHLFASGDEATINFSAGDFREEAGAKGGKYYPCEKPTVVKVYIASQNEENNWVELSTTEVPENYYFPAYGYYYTAKVSNCADGWYNLKFELVDRVGNKQVQIVNPALYFGSNPTGALFPINYGDVDYIHQGDVICIEGMISSKIVLYSLEGDIVRYAIGNKLGITDIPRGTYILSVQSNGMVNCVKLML